MRIIFAPEAASEALARALAHSGGADCAPAEGAMPAGERAAVLVTPDYYSSALWQMKRWLTAQAGRLDGMLCACLVRSDSDIGADLAIRALSSRLLADGAAVYLCAVAGADERIRPGGFTQRCEKGWTAPEFYTKFRQMADKFG